MKANVALRPHLSSSLGGAKGNKTSCEALSGCNCTAGKCIVSKAMEGVRRKDFESLSSSSLLSSTSLFVKSAVKPKQPKTDVKPLHLFPAATASTADKEMRVQSQHRRRPKRRRKLLLKNNQQLKRNRRHPTTTSPICRQLSNLS